jgi:acetaldehyde dehydrogenase
VIGAAVIGSGNIGTDLMIKLLRSPGPLRVSAMAGIDPASEGLARAARLGVATTADGVKGLVALTGFDEIAVVFDASSATAHVANATVLAPYDIRVIDLSSWTSPST